jgi:hypothetical protein
METPFEGALGVVSSRLMFQLYLRLVLDAVTVGDAAVLTLPCWKDPRSGVCGIDTLNLGASPTRSCVPDDEVESSGHFLSML